MTVRRFTDRWQGTAAFVLALLTIATISVTALVRTFRPETRPTPASLILTDTRPGGIVVLHQSPQRFNQAPLPLTITNAGDIAARRLTIEIHATGVLQFVGARRLNLVSQRLTQGSFHVEGLHVLRRRFASDEETTFHVDELDPKASVNLDGLVFVRARTLVVSGSPLRFFKPGERKAGSAADESLSIPITVTISADNVPSQSIPGLVVVDVVEAWGYPTKTPTPVPSGLQIP